MILFLGEDDLSSPINLEEGKGEDDAVLQPHPILNNIKKLLVNAEGVAKKVAHKFAVSAHLLHSGGA